MKKGKEVLEIQLDHYYTLGNRDSGTVFLMAKDNVGILKCALLNILNRMSIQTISLRRKRAYKALNNACESSRGQNKSKV